MIEDIRKYQHSPLPRYSLSVLVPSWNNLDYLKLCLGSIRKNSGNAIQMIVIVNEGKDGTADWLESQGDIDYIHASENIGICYGLNIARSLIKSDYLVYVNDDMYLLPGWDVELLNEIRRIGHKSFMLSSTMIEPADTGNSCVLVKNYGDDLESFREQDLLKEFQELEKSDWNGSTWPPNVVHVDSWDLVGGMSTEFSPGMYSDPDLSMKLVQAGVRYFKGLGKARVYHFGSKSTKRVKRNKGRKMFLLKWGITANTFMRKYLRIGEPFRDDLAIPGLEEMTDLVSKFKRMRNSW
ncbi:MAG: glycosyltransferase [Bacteroidetes bacterium]|nr:glycosyltransferase [Bacteroidota bacterium]